MKNCSNLFLPSSSKENCDCNFKSSTNLISLKYKNYLKNSEKLNLLKVRPKWQLKQMYKIIFLLLLIMGNFPQIYSHYYSNNNKILTKETFKSKDYQGYIHSSSSINSFKNNRHNKTGNLNYYFYI